MKKVFGTIVAVVLIGLLLYAAWTQRMVLLKGLSALTVGQLLLVAAAMIPTYPLSVFSWHQLLRGLGGKLSYKEALAVWMLSNVARLLPGTVWQWVGRVYLAGTHGVSTLQSSLSVAYEIAVLVVSALVVGLGTLPLWPEALRLPGWMAVLVVVPLVLLWPTFLPAVVRLYAKVRKQPLSDIPPLPWLNLLAAVAATVLQFFLSGLALWLLLGAFVQLPISYAIALAGMQAMTWLLGYVTVLAPGGLGVADASLAGLLGSTVALSISSAVALLFRGLLLISEILVTLVAIALHPKVLRDARRQTIN